MSHENAKTPTAGRISTFADQTTTIVRIDGKCAIQISMSNEEEALKKKESIEQDKFRYEEDYMFSPTYLLSSNYSISTQSNNIVIQGPLKELDSAIQRLHAYGRHISEQRKEELLKEINKIHLKEILVRERQARQEKQNKKSTNKSSTKPAKDPNAFFPNTRAAGTKTASIPSFTTPTKNPKIK